MTDAEMILRTITHRRPDDATVTAAVDALREQCGEDWYGALDAVVTAHRESVESKQIADAAVHVQSDAPGRELLLADLYHYAGLPATVAASVTVVGGNLAPHIRRVFGRGERRLWGEYWLTVGAVWLLNHVKARQQQGKRIEKLRRARWSQK